MGNVLKLLGLYMSATRPDTQTDWVKLASNELEKVVWKMVGLVFLVFLFASGMMMLTYRLLEMGIMALNQSNNWILDPALCIGILFMLVGGGFLFYVKQSVGKKDEFKDQKDAIQDKIEDAQVPVYRNPIMAQLAAERQALGKNFVPN